MNPQQRRFDEIQVGEQASFEILVDDVLVDRFATLTGDVNPLHMDQGYAERSMFSGRIAHGMLLASHFSTLVGMYLPGAYALYLSQEVRFLKPVHIGETVCILGKVLAASAASRVLTLQTQVRNAGDELIVDGEARVMIVEPPREELIPQVPAEFSLRGRVALVTGASRGIGASTAALLAQHGAAVVLNYRKDKDQADAVRNQIVAAGGRAVAIQADVADEQAVRGMFSEAKTQLGPVDILINNAAPPLHRASFDAVPWDVFQQDFSMIVGGACRCVRAALPDMVQAKRGVIVNVLTSNVMGAPQPQLASYVSAKYGLLGLTKSLAVELGPKGIRVNAVAPGLTETVMTAYVPPRAKELAAHQTPLRRIGAPLDTAKAVLFLVSGASDFLSGVCLPVTGGASMI